MRVVITSRGFAEKGEFQGSSSPNDPESILREAGFEVVNLSSAGFGAQSTENEIFEALKDADAAIVGLEPITESLIRRLPKLRAVTRRGIGYDSVDIDACRARGITVMRTTGAVEGAVAEHVMAYLLYFARRLDLQNQSMQSGHWERMAMPGSPVQRSVSSGLAESERKSRAARRLSESGFCIPAVIRTLPGRRSSGSPTLRWMNS